MHLMMSGACVTHVHHGWKVPHLVIQVQIPIFRRYCFIFIVPFSPNYQCAATDAAIFSVVVATSGDLDRKCFDRSL